MLIRQKMLISLPDAQFLINAEIRPTLDAVEIKEIVKL